MTVRAAVQIVAVIASLGSLACGAKTPTEPDPPAPVYELKTSTFSGTVKTGGTVAFPFTVVNPGAINVSITELGPVSTLTMGITMGFWDTITSTCSEQAAAPSATLNVVYTATPSAPGEYCVGIFDTGNVQVSSDFTLKVTYY
jgi:hypothetical protein